MSSTCRLLSTRYAALTQAGDTHTLKYTSSRLFLWLFCSVATLLATEPIFNRHTVNLRLLGHAARFITAVRFGLCFMRECSFTTNFFVFHPLPHATNSAPPVADDVTSGGVVCDAFARALRKGDDACCAWNRGTNGASGPQGHIQLAGRASGWPAFRPEV